MLEDLDGDGVQDIILGTYDPVNPYAGGVVFAIDVNGNDLPGWPKAIPGGPFAGAPAVGDIDNNGDMEVVIGSWQRAYVWNHDGTNYPGWPKNYGTSKAPALSDLDGDGDLEILYPASGNRLYVWHHDGTVLPGWPYTAPDLIGSPAVADIDGDGDLEIAAGTFAGPVGPDPYEVYAWETDGSVVPGFPVATSGTVKGSVTLGDVDADGQVEIVACAYHTSNNDYLYVWDAAGNLETGWPVQATYTRLSDPALCDLDGDGDLEIVIGGLDPGPFEEELFAFHHDGTSVAGWPVVLTSAGPSGNINSSPVIADIDGDPSQVEVVVKVTNWVFAVHADGTIVANFPYELSDQNHSGTHSPSPAVGDMDGDGDVEYVFVSSFGTIAFFDRPDAWTPGLAFWPMFKRDAHNTAYLPPLFGLGDLNCDGTLDAFDIDPFVLALTDPVGYAAQYPDCDRMLADIDGDGDVDAFDIDPFVELLVGP